MREAKNLLFRLFLSGRVATENELTKHLLVGFNRNINESMLSVNDAFDEVLVVVLPEVRFVLAGALYAHINRSGTFQATQLWLIFT